MKPALHPVSGLVAGKARKAIYYQFYFGSNALKDKLLCGKFFHGRISCFEDNLL